MCCTSSFINLKIQTIFRLIQYKIIFNLDLKYTFLYIKRVCISVHRKQIIKKIHLMRTT